MTSRPEVSPAFVARHKRRRMMDAMADLCAERGYATTKIADVVARAAVARKTLYDNFGGKEELLLATFEEAAGEAREAVGDACRDAAERGTDTVEAGLGALLTFLATHPAQARMCMVEALSATPASAAGYEVAIRGFIDLLWAAAPRPRQTTVEMLVGGVAWILQRRLRREGAEGVEKLLPDLSLFVSSPYRGVENPGR